MSELSSGATRYCVTQLRIASGMIKQCDEIIDYITQLETKNERLKKICAKPWADSKRLDKLERLLKRGACISAHHWDAKREEWSGALLDFETEDDDELDTVIADTARDVLDKLEEDHE